MSKKYIPIVLILLLASYAIFDFLSKEDAVTLDMENTDETKTESLVVEDKLAQDTSDELTETGFIEANQPSPKAEFAPGFILSDLTGAGVNLSDFKGRIVILNFWATWCPPCREEMPHMQSFYEKNKENDIEILAVNLTNMDDGQQAIEKFVQDYGLTFPVLLDDNGDVGERYEIMTIPTSYILDTEGRIFQKVVGPMNEEMMNEIVNSIRMNNKEHGE